METGAKFNEHRVQTWFRYLAPRLAVGLAMGGASSVVAVHGVTLFFSQSSKSRPIEGVQALLDAHCPVHAAKFVFLGWVGNGRVFLRQHMKALADAC